MIEQLKVRLKGKIVIACIGNILKSDDGAGPALAIKLEGKIRAAVINCEDTPENETGRIKALNPDTIVLIDAIHMNTKPGSVSILEKEILNEMELYTTHNVPLKVFTNYLSIETKADVFLIGIQPKTLAFNKGLSPVVEKTVDHLADIFEKLLG